MIMPRNIIIMPLYSIIMPRKILIMPLNSIIMPLHIIIMPLNSLIMPRNIIIILLKGTQAWEFFGLRYWNLYFFVVSYAEMLRFRLKKNFVGPLLGEIELFCVYWDYAEWKKIFELGKFLFYFSSLKCPLYIC